MKNFIIDKEKCISCGLCVKDCSTAALSLDSENKPTIIDSRCMECQHCLAVCPTGAISILGKNPDLSEEVPIINSQEVLNTIKTRRSIRQFKNEDISEEMFEKLQNALNYVPTGRNNHNLLFSITKSRKETDVIRNYVRNELLRRLKTFPFNLFVKKYARYIKLFEKGIDVIFRNAPHVVVACSPKNAPCADVDPIIALSYLELYANSLGLGTCWCGLAQYCFKLLPKLTSMFKIPKGYKPVYVMLLGVPDIKYKRMTQPNAYEFIDVKVSHLNDDGC